MSIRLGQHGVFLDDYLINFFLQEPRRYPRNKNNAENIKTGMEPNVDVFEPTFARTLQTKAQN